MRLWGICLSMSDLFHLAQWSQPFWHQRPVSWKTVFPQMEVGWGGGDGSGSNASDGSGGNASDGE